MSDMQLTISESASAQIQHLLAKDSKPDGYFRLRVDGGGCSGFQYKFSIETDTPAKDDHIFTHGNTKVVVDELSLGFVTGAELNFVEDLAGAQFEVKNPNSTANCGCGSSFSVM